MATTDILDLTLIEAAQGGKEVTANEAIAELAKAAVGTLTVTTPTTGMKVLTATEARNGIIRVLLTLTGNLIIELPLAMNGNEVRIVVNDTTGAFTVQVRYGPAGSLTTVTQATTFIVGDGWSESLAGGGGGGAPTTATYITQTADGGLSAEQALGALATGILKVTTGTGVVSIAVSNTDYAAAAHVARHENGGADEMSVTGLSGELADAQPVTIRKNTGADVGTRSRINLIEGANVTLTVADDAGSDEVDVTIAAAGGAGSPLTVSENGTPVDASVTTIDFLGADFDVAESPEDEVNVSISTAIARAADVPTNATFNDHSARHENGGADEISVAGLSGLLADSQTPLSHTHVLADITDEGALAALDTVGTTEIDNLAVTTAKLADAAVTPAKTAFRTVSAKTTGYTVANTDYLTLFTNTGAAGLVTLTLPAAPTTGLYFGAYVDDTDGIRILAVGTQTIVSGPHLSQAAGYIECLDIGGYVELLWTGSVWIATNHRRPWRIQSTLGVLYWTGEERTGSKAFDFWTPDAYQAETFPRGTIGENSYSALLSGVITLNGIYLERGTIVTNIHFWTAGTAFTPGNTNNQNVIFGLYEGLTLRANSTMPSGVVTWALNAEKTLAMTTPFEIVQSGLYYLACMIYIGTGGSPLIPTMRGRNVLNKINALPPIVAGRSTTGLTTASVLPGTAAAISSGSEALVCYGAVS